MSSYRITFVTEKRLDTEQIEIGPHVVHRAYVSLAVAGSNKYWIDRTVRELEPSMVATKLSGIYWPLWIFRSKYFVEMLSWLLGFAGFNSGFRATLDYFERHNLSIEQTLSKIYDTQDINQKINMIAKMIANPSLLSVIDMLLCMIVGFASMAIITITGMYLLPKFNPSSMIAVGYAKKRAESYLNVVKVFVVGTFVSAGLIPALKWIWNLL